MFGYIQTQRNERFGRTVRERRRKEGGVVELPIRGRQRDDSNILINYMGECRCFWNLSYHFMSCWGASRDDIVKELELEDQKKGEGAFKKTMLRSTCTR